MVAYCTLVNLNCQCKLVEITIFIQISHNLHLHLSCKLNVFQLITLLILNIKILKYMTVMKKQDLSELIKVRNSSKH